MKFRLLPKFVFYPVIVYLFAIVFNFIFRLVFLFSTFNHLKQIPSDERFQLLKWAFFMGWRFDTIAVAYCLIIPFLLLVLSLWLKRFEKQIISLVTIVASVLFSVSFMVASADIPYFKYYDTRVNISIFQWFDSGFTSLFVILQEPSYLLSLFLYLVFSVVFFIALIKIKNKVLINNSNQKKDQHSTWKIGVMMLMMLTLFFHGFKANFKSPLRVDDAMRTKYSYINQLSLNPLFSLVKSYFLNKKTSFMEDELAIQNTRRYLNINDTCYNSPIARFVRNDSVAKKPNVVIIFLESMSTMNMQYFGNKDNLTPFLDGLVKESMFFENIYSTGIHTHNAIFSTLWSYPSLSRVRQMCANNINKFTGLPGFMKSYGYKNFFFATHDKEFDNIFDFLLKNDFDTIISRENYPDSLVVNAFGIPDHVMLQRGIKVMNESYSKGERFFMTFLTNSNHLPYTLPTKIPFVPKSKSMDNKMIEYSDWAISDFFSKAKNQPWFDNTLFVIFGDHGQIRYFNAYDVPLSYNHIPLFFYAPKIIKQPMIISKFGGQCDIFPTVMGLLGYSYINNTPGIDLIKEKRPYIFFTTDYKIGCIDDTYFYVFRENQGQSLYKYRSNDLTDYKDSLPAITDSMKMYALSILQASQLNIKFNKTGPDSCR